MELLYGIRMRRRPCRLAGSSVPTDKILLALVKGQVGLMGDMSRFQTEVFKVPAGVVYVNQVFFRVAYSLFLLVALHGAGWVFSAEQTIDRGQSESS